MIIWISVGIACVIVVVIAVFALKKRSIVLPTPNV